MTRVDWGQVATTRELFLFVAVILAVGLIGLRLFFAPLSKEATLLREKDSTLRLEKEALAKFSALSPDVTPASPGMRRKGVKRKILAGEVWTTYPDVASFLSQLTDPLFLGRVVVKNLVEQPPMRGGGFRKTDFTLNLSGDFADLLECLERLEEFPALFSLEHLSLKGAGGGRDLEAEIQGRFFQMERGNL